MGRKKGESYRKGKLKEVRRRKCPEWTISEKTLAMLANASSSIGACQSRLVEAALNRFLTNTSQNLHNPAKLEQLFTKS